MNEGGRTTVMRVKGEWATRRVWVDGEELFPSSSQKIRNHSPDGFNWSYGGSGPAQLALALCLAAGMTKEKALENYQRLKWDFVATLPGGDFEKDLYIEEAVIRFYGQKVLDELAFQIGKQNRLRAEKDEPARGNCGEDW